ncbi:MAG: MBL fold metallo-hydrolase [Propionibacteriaceae bacterium]|nr:MBL fold metallo-hydrolase [Propionibacteriaceae bacterium]
MTGPATSPNRTTASEGSWEPIVDGIYRLVAEPDAVTIGLIVGSESALLVDCGSTPDQGARLRESVASVTDKPLLGVVITHEDRDHWFGLAAFDDLESWGHETLAERIDAPEVLAEAERLGLTRADLRTPKNDFSIACALDLGDRYVELVHLGHAHTPNDVVVNVPGSNVVFTGDLIENPHPWFGPASSPRGWPATLNMMIGMVKSDAIVVPGHGDLVDAQYIVQTLAGLASVPYETERLVHAGVTFEGAEEAGEWPIPWPNIAEGVRTAYAEMSAQGVRRNLPLV